MGEQTKHFMPKALIVGMLAVAIGVAVFLKEGTKEKTASPGDDNGIASGSGTSHTLANAGTDSRPLPKLLDLGSGTCIPCKAMAPILEELKETYAGVFDVQFIDVKDHPEAARQYGIQLIPTQIFFDIAGQERFRHEGFFSREDILATWDQLGVELATVAPPASTETFQRFETASLDERDKESVCYMCDGDIQPQTRTVLKTDKGEVAFCSPHCYFITWSSMVGEKPADADVTVTDWSTGTTAPAASAHYVYGMDPSNRPTIKAFADEAPAEAERAAAGGNRMTWADVQKKEQTTLCGFCDRAVYPEDAGVVKVAGGLSTWGCCPMCSLGVAARLQKDIEVTEKDALTGEAVLIKTLSGHVASLEPAGAVAWAGSRKNEAGDIVSTGCFKQAVFASEDNLKEWVQAHPTATGRMISIEAALAAKMKLTPQQISQACKIGECAPK